MGYRHVLLCSDLVPTKLACSVCFSQATLLKCPLFELVTNVTTAVVVVASVAVFVPLAASVICAIYDALPIVWPVAYRTIGLTLVGQQDRPCSASEEGVT